MLSSRLLLNRNLTYLHASGKQCLSHEMRRCPDGGRIFSLISFQSQIRYDLLVGQKSCYGGEGEE